MKGNNLTFVSFEFRNGRFVGFLSMDDAVHGLLDPEALLRNAADIYEKSIIKMRSIIHEIQTARAHHNIVPAQKIWDLGQVIFELKDNLEKLTLQLDSVYNHLVRDLGVKRKWLEKVVILRRYIPNKNSIPKSLNWGRCEKGTRRIAQNLAKGLPVD
jgi:hypothetical protein